MKLLALLSCFAFVLLAAGTSCLDVPAVVDLLRSGKAVVAQEYLQARAAGCRSEAEWHYLEARALCQLGEYEGARSAAGQAIALGGDLAEYHRFAATVNAKLGNTEAARNHVRRMIALRSGRESDTQAETFLAVVLAQNGRTQTALEVLNPILIEKPDDVRALYYRALFEQSLADYPSAALGYRRILELEPGNRDARRQLAVIDVETGQPAAGLATLKTLLSSKAEPELLFHIAQAHWKLGHATAAEKAIRQAVEAAPFEAKYRKQLGMILLRAGASAEGRGEISEGERLERAALR